MLECQLHKTVKYRPSVFTIVTRANIALQGHVIFIQSKFDPLSDQENL